MLTKSLHFLKQANTLVEENFFQLEESPTLAHPWLFVYQKNNFVKKLSPASPQIWILSQSSPQVLTKVTPDFIKSELELARESFSLTTWILKDSKTTMRKNSHISFLEISWLHSNLDLCLPSIWPRIPTIFPLIPLLELLQNSTWACLKLWLPLALHLPERWAEFC